MHLVEDGVFEPELFAAVDHSEKTKLTDDISFMLFDPVLFATRHGEALYRFSRGALAGTDAAGYYYEHKTASAAGGSERPPLRPR